MVFEFIIEHEHEFLSQVKLEWYLDKYDEETKKDESKVPNINHRWLYLKVEKL